MKLLKQNFITSASNGHRGLSCRKSAGTIPTHKAINKIMSQALSSAGFQNLLPPPGIHRDDGKRLDGTTIIS